NQARSRRTIVNCCHHVNKARAWARLTMPVSSRTPLEGSPDPASGCIASGPRRYRTQEGGGTGHDRYRGGFPSSRRPDTPARRIDHPGPDPQNRRPLLPGHPVPPTPSPLRPVDCLAVIPARDEAATVADVVAGVRLALGCEVLVVDDASRDDTAARARAA